MDGARYCLNLRRCCTLFTDWAGPSAPLSLPETMGGLTDNASWVLILFGYAAIASLLPVWMLLQPRDYINGLQLFIV